MNAGELLNVVACHHEDFHEDCEGCFTEAISGGLMGLRDLLPGADFVLTERVDGYATGTVSYEGVFLMTWEYARGEGAALQEDARQIIEDLIGYYRIQRTHWTMEVGQAREKEMPDREHRALSREGEMGKHLDRVTSWSAG